MNTLAERIKTARREMGWSQQELAEACGWESTSRVGNYEQGTREPSLEQIQAMAAAMGVSWGWLATGEGEMAPRKQISVLANIAAPTRIPLISWTTAGHWGELQDTYAPGDAESMVKTTARVGRHAYALRIRGDSMEPAIPDGATIIVDPSADAVPGKIVIVRQNNDAEATCKRLIRDGNRLYLRPENPRYPILEMREDAVICGVVRQVVLDLD